VSLRRAANKTLKLTHVAISRVDEHGDPRTGCMPCGACLQVMAEFGSLTTEILLDNLYHFGETAEFTLGNLLPEQFWFPAD
jgi:cytidine deaminase